MGMNTASVQRLYVAYFNRPADPVSLAVYEGMLPSDREATSAELLVVAETYFSPSAEYTSNFTGKSNAQVVDQLYQNIFGRVAEASGLISWATKLTDGSITVAELALELSYSAQGTDATVVSARIEAATTFTNGLDTADEITGYSGDAAAAQGKAYLAQISGALPTTDDAITTSKDTAITNVDTSIAAAVEAGSNTPGETYTFTTGTDKFGGTINADTYNGVLVSEGEAGTTLAAGDSVTASDGVDTLALSISGAADNAAFTLTAVDAEVEKFLVSNFDTHANTHTISTSLMGSLTTVGNSASSTTGDTVFSGMTKFVNGVMKNGTGDLTLTYDGSQVVTGTSDAVTLTVGAQTGGAFSANGIELITIDSTLSANTITVASNALKTLTVTGSAALNVGTLNFAANGTKAAPGAVVDASAATGNVTLTTTAAEVFDIKGGTGNDTFTLGAAMTANDIVDGGDGNDTVVNADQDTVSMTTLRMTDVENFVTEASNNANLAVTATGTTVSNIQVTENNTTAKNISVTGLGAATSVAIANNVDGQAIGTVTISLADPAGSDDSLSVAVNGTSGQGAETVAGVTLANVETVNLSSGSVGATAMLAATDSNVITTLNVGGTATVLNVDGAANLTITNAITGAKLTTIDGSSATGSIGITAAAVNYAALKGGSGNDTFAMGTTLTIADSIDGGGNTGATGVDTVTATVNALGSATVAAVLDIDNVETVSLNATTAASYIDLSGSTGVATLNVGDAQGAAGSSLSISGMAGTTKVGLGGITTDKEMTGTVIVNLADETGTADNVVFVLAESDGDNDVNATLQVGTGTTTITTGVEKTTITVDDQNATGNATLNVTKVASAELEITGGAADLTPDEVLALGTLNTQTTKVDASTFTGALSITGSASATTMTVKQGAAANTIVLGAANDTLTLSDLEDDDADGGGGTGDTLNATIDGSETEATTNFEIINYTIGNNVQTTVSAANGKGVDTAVTFNLLGGDALTTWTHDLVSPTTLTSYNMAGYTGGSTALNVAATANGLSAVTITGSAGADTLTFTSNSNNLTVKSMTGVETMGINAVGAATAFDFSKTTGVTTVKTDDDNTARDITLTDLSTGTAVEITSGAATSGVIIDLADKTALDNAVTIKVGTTVGAVDIDAADVETVNINSATGASEVDLAGLSMTTAAATNTLNISGNQALTISGLHQDNTTINASTMTTGGSVVQTAREANGVVEYTGSLGNDTFIMMNTSDVIKAGAGTDTLDINTTAVLGGIVVDLTVTDNVLQANGALNTTEQSGFINVDLAGYAGGYGAVVTANKAGSIIVGTGAVDQFTGGVGGDTMTGGAGNDVITLGTGGTDTLIRNGNGTTDGTDTVASFVGGTDVIDFTTNGAKEGGAAVTGFVSGALGTIATGKGLAVFSSNITTADATTVTAAEMETYLGATAVFFNGATADSVYIVMDNGTNTFVTKVTEGADGTNKQFDVADDSFQLIMVLTGVTDATTLTAASFADFT